MWAYNDCALVEASINGEYNGNSWLSSMSVSWAHNFLSYNQWSCIDNGKYEHSNVRQSLWRTFIIDFVIIVCCEEHLITSIIMLQLAKMDMLKHPLEFCVYLCVRVYIYIYIAVRVWVFRIILNSIEIYYWCEGVFIVIRLRSQSIPTASRFPSLRMAYMYVTANGEHF